MHELAKLEEHVKEDCRFGAVNWSITLLFLLLVMQRKGNPIMILDHISLSLFSNWWDNRFADNNYCDFEGVSGKNANCWSYLGLELVNTVKAFISDHHGVLFKKKSGNNYSRSDQNYEQWMGVAYESFDSNQKNVWDLEILLPMLQRLSYYQCYRGWRMFGNALVNSNFFTDIRIGWNILTNYHNYAKQGLNIFTYFGHWHTYKYNIIRIKTTLSGHLQEP